MLRRLEKRILVDVPNAQAREAMFRHYLPKIVLKQPALKCDIYYEFLSKVQIYITSTLIYTYLSILKL